MWVKDEENKNDRKDGRLSALGEETMGGIAHASRPLASYTSSVNATHLPFGIPLVASTVRNYIRPFSHANFPFKPCL